jgi:hypothetical protein
MIVATPNQDPILHPSFHRTYPLHLIMPCDTILQGQNKLIFHPRLQRFQIVHGRPCVRRTTFLRQRIDLNNEIQLTPLVVFLPLLNRFARYYEPCVAEMIELDALFIPLCP